jgi:hypothetical protein
MVHGDAAGCLDPTLTFQVGAPPPPSATTGESLRLPVFANRMNVGIDYTWSVLSRPAGSSATVHNATGSVSSSGTGYEYTFTGAAPSFTPDYPGTWTLQLNAKLVKDDPAFPGFDSSSTQISIPVTGKPKSGCSSPGDVSGVVLLLAGLVLRRRRG